MRKLFNLFLVETQTYVLLLHGIFNIVLEIWDPFWSFQARDIIFSFNGPCYSHSQSDKRERLKGKETHFAFFWILWIVSLDGIASKFQLNIKIEYWGV